MEPLLDNNINGTQNMISINGTQNMDMVSNVSSMHPTLDPIGCNDPEKELINSAVWKCEQVCLNYMISLHSCGNTDTNMENIYHYNH